MCGIVGYIGKSPAPSVLISGLRRLEYRGYEQDERIADLAANYAANEHAFFIGRGYQYPVALEGALKLKEISYIHAEGYQAAAALQLFAYHVARHRGHEIDQPRNLAKSVTVE